MSTQPSGWQAPRTSWQSADVPGAADFSRIESNTNAIEAGARTLDPALAPTSNTGTLRQILSWIANRIKAIMGTTTWYSAPPVTLSAAKGHIDNKQNPHGVTAAQVGAATTTALGSHTSNNQNPHGVTAAQVGGVAYNSKSFIVSGNVGGDAPISIAPEDWTGVQSICVRLEAGEKLVLRRAMYSMSNTLMCLEVNGDSSWISSSNLGDDYPDAIIYQSAGLKSIYIRARNSMDANATLNKLSGWTLFFEVTR